MLTRIISNESFYLSSLSLSADGGALAFESLQAFVPADTNTTVDIYLRNTQTGAMSIASLTPDGRSIAAHSKDAVVSGDGKVVSFSSDSSELTQGLRDYGGIVARNMASGVLTPADANAIGLHGNSGSGNATISGNGRYVAFESASNNLAAGDTNSSYDVYVKDLQSGALVLASADSNGKASGAGDSTPCISGDGRYVVYTNSSNALVAGDQDYHDFLYLKDMQTGALTMVSTTSSGAAANMGAGNPFLAADGRHLAFNSYSTNLGGPGYQVYMKNLDSGQVSVVSASAAGVAGDADSGYEQQSSSDGRLVIFSSAAGNLVPNDSNHVEDVFVKDVQSGAIFRLSVDANGVQGNGVSALAALSADGHVAVFRSDASNLVGGDTNHATDVFQVRIPEAFFHAGTLAATAGNDTLQGGSGNDSIDGGAGTDTVLLRGYRASFSVINNGGVLTVQDSTPVDGTDVLSHVERLQFFDSAFAFDIGGNAGQAYRIYQAAFNRAPDAAGLGFWIHAMDGGMALNDVAAGFIASAEFKTMYGAAPSNADLVGKFYTNVLHRAGDAGGIAFWTGVLDNHSVTAAGALAGFSESPENQAALIGVIGNGIGYVPFG